MLYSEKKQEYSISDRTSWYAVILKFIEVIWFLPLQHNSEKILVCCIISIYWDYLILSSTVEFQEKLDMLYKTRFSHMEAKYKVSRITKTFNFTVKPLACHLEALGIVCRFAKNLSFTVKSKIIQTLASQKSHTTSPSIKKAVALCDSL